MSTPEEVQLQNNAEPSMEMTVNQEGNEKQPREYAEGELTVLGIYRRRVVPEEDVLDFKDLECHHVMARERLNTLPLEDFRKQGQQQEREGDDSKSFDKAWFRPMTGLDMGQGREEAENKDEKKDESTTKEADQNQEANLNEARPVEQEENKERTPYLRPFFHENLEYHSKTEWGQRVFEERAVLFQSVENYQALMEHSTLSKHFVDAKSKEEALEEFLGDPRFGEQLIVQGMNSSDICIGDIFAVEDGLSTLKFQVSSPRKPCKYVDKRNGSPFGTKGVKQYTLTAGLAGWFTRVLEEGELVQGMKLVRISQIASPDLQNPPRSEEERLWSLTELSKALYGEGTRRKQLMCYPHWSRPWIQLEYLAESEVLGGYEWRDEIEWLIEEEGENVELVKKPAGEDDDDDITVATQDTETTEIQSQQQQSWGCDVFAPVCSASSTQFWTSFAACAITASICAGTTMCMDLSEYTFCA